MGNVDRRLPAAVGGLRGNLRGLIVDDPRHHRVAGGIDGDLGLADFAGRGEVDRRFPGAPEAAGPLNHPGGLRHVELPDRGGVATGVDRELR
jgi:hypothetical protein